MAPEVIWAGSAARALKKIDKDAKVRILTEVGRLAAQPFPPGSKKLSGSPAHRLRVGDYRVVYQFDEPKGRIVVLKVGHRKEVYTRLPELKD
ncbi:MAG: type II toxin-antitoxin system RelE family toxin [Thermodesulfobacteriota bacterium]